MVVCTWRKLIPPFLHTLQPYLSNFLYLSHALAHTPPNEVAIKLINIDDVDYAANAAEREQSLADVRQEIKVLTQLKDYGVANVNLIHDVLEIDGFLWLVCEYCPGGSLRTLVCATRRLS